MKIEKFSRHTEDSLIIIQCALSSHQITLAVDTGASHTTIDLTTLLIAGIEIKDALRIEQVQTASGIVDAYVFNVAVFTAFGISKQNVEVCAYDFFAHGVLTEFDGVLGIDFLSEYKICIDFIKSVITIHD